MQQYLCYNTGSQLVINVQGSQQYDDKMDKGKKYNKNTSCGHSEPENCRRAPPPPLHRPLPCSFRTIFIRFLLSTGFRLHPPVMAKGGGRSDFIKNAQSKTS